MESNINDFKFQISDLRKGTGKENIFHPSFKTKKKRGNFIIMLQDMTIKELTSYVCKHLNSKGIQVILSGGAVVSFYSKNEYESMDLDFIENISSSRRKIAGIQSHQLEVSRPVIPSSLIPHLFLSTPHTRRHL